MSDLVDDMIGDGYYSTHEEFLEAHGEKKTMPVSTEDLTKLGKAIGATEKAKPFSVRFNLNTYDVSPKKVTFLHFTETPAKTPTGGRYIRRTLIVRDKSGQKYVGNIRKDAKGTVSVNMKPYTDPRTK